MRAWAQIKIRVPVELHAELKVAARAEGRSVNAEIVRRVQAKPQPQLPATPAPVPLQPVLLQPGQRVALQVDGHGVLAATVLGQTPADLRGPPRRETDEPRAKFCEPESQENWAG
ncbi:MAG: hypothetical protein BGP24_14860 [Lysobacterales bacterium 69-70]|nr:Arc family DNA-binding protein [Xanthomonadaceae bacterium]ODU35364.1 MAG: hypothetical protein ABS97_05685 [Xanthomonadaceae bacterium SCN 69-320]ODV16871.1 MAG: hypothetical protein ABT27_19030 [Xanthomonadaceae bacterium SCN 69-25]OJY94259.1 MAG: hypothetical protein BGP24_14860 [Xanthomonadales bacterium 69-70]